MSKKAFNPKSGEFFEISGAKKPLPKAPHRETILELKPVPVKIDKPTVE